MNKEKSIKQAQEAKANHFLNCFNFAVKWIKKTNLTKFSSEDIIDAYEATNEPKPAEKRVWGSVMRELAKAKVIRFKEYGIYKKLSGHAKPIYIWQKF